MKKKILIVDDEKIARDRIKRFLQTYPQPIELFEAENGPIAIECIKRIQPDIVLLDIQMPVMTGFDLLYQLETRNFQLIFQTAYDEFAVKAFEVSACDYLLKPFTEERLHSAIKKAIAQQQPVSRLSDLERHLENSNVFLKTIVSKTGSTTKVLRIDDIHAFKSEDHYTFAITDDSEFILDHSLSWLENKLDPKVFIRGHRSNILRISSIEKFGGSETTSVKLKNGISLPLSRENRKKIQCLF